jgi:glycerophosphoryl diester phosphodiesterase
MNMGRVILTLVVWGCMIGGMPVVGAQPLIIAHRGASADAPENTLAAFRLAWEQGADGAEGDFRLTKDGEVVCLHDSGTKRTGDKAIDVVKSTLEELRTVDVGRWKSPKFAGERMPTLAEVLAVVPPGKTFFIEVKGGPEIMPALERVVARSSVKAEQLRIIAFNAEVIVQAKRRLPQVKAQWLTEFEQDEATKAWVPDTAAVLRTLKEIGADGLNAQGKTEVLTAEFVGRLKALNLETGAWTVDDPGVARMLARALTTNRPALIRGALATARGDGNRLPSE